MTITVAELKNDFDKYLLLAETEDIYITHNNNVVAMLSNPYQNRVEIAKSLFGILGSGMKLEEPQKGWLKREYDGS